MNEPVLQAGAVGLIKALGLTKDAPDESSTHPLMTAIERHKKAKLRPVQHR